MEVWASYEQFLTISLDKSHLIYVRDVLADIAMQLGLQDGSILDYRLFIVKVENESSIIE